MIILTSLFIFIIKMWFCLFRFIANIQKKTNFQKKIKVWEQSTKKEVQKKILVNLSAVVNKLHNYVKTNSSAFLVSRFRPLVLDQFAKLEEIIRQTKKMVLDTQKSKQTKRKECIVLLKQVLDHFNKL